MQNQYSHLYNTSTYVPPSIVRKIEEASPGVGEVFGETRFIHGRNSVESASGQNYMNNLMNVELKNRSTYREMKNKVLYSLDNEIVSHSLLNQL